MLLILHNFILFLKNFICSYINFSNIAARLLRQALKSEFKADAAKRNESHIRITKWADGKPISKYFLIIQIIR